VSRFRPLLLLALWCAAVYLWVALGLFAVKSAWLTMAVYHLALCGGGWLRLRPSRPPRFAFKHAAPAILMLSGGFILAWLVMGHLLPLLPPGVVPSVTTHGLSGVGLSARTYPFIALYFGIVNPLAEEAFWRGRILPLLVDARSPAPNLLHALVFTGFHLLPLALMFAPPALPACIVFLGGFTFGAVALRSRNLLIPWALHTGVNAYLLIWFGRFFTT